MKCVAITWRGVGIKRIRHAVLLSYLSVIMGLPKAVPAPRHVDRIKSVNDRIILQSYTAAVVSTLLVLPEKRRTQSGLLLWPPYSGARGSCCPYKLARSACGEGPIDFNLRQGRSGCRRRSIARRPIQLSNLFFDLTIHFTLTSAFNYKLTIPNPASRATSWHFLILRKRTRKPYEDPFKQSIVDPTSLRSSENCSG